MTLASERRSSARLSLSRFATWSCIHPAKAALTSATTAEMMATTSAVSTSRPYRERLHLGDTWPRATPVPAKVTRRARVAWAVQSDAGEPRLGVLDDLTGQADGVHDGPDQR